MAARVVRRPADKPSGPRESSANQPIGPAHKVAKVRASLGK